MIWRATSKDVGKVEGWIERDFHKVDYSEVLANELNVCLCQGEGGAVFVWRGPGVYEVHCFFEQRGQEVRQISRAMLSIMAKNHAARLVWAAIPNDSRKVKIYVRWLGFKSVGFATFPHGECELFTWESDQCLQ